VLINQSCICFVNVNIFSIQACLCMEAQRLLLPTSSTHNDHFCWGHFVALTQVRKITLFAVQNRSAYQIVVKAVILHLYLNKFAKKNDPARRTQLREYVQTVASPLQNNLNGSSHINLLAKVSSPRWFEVGDPGQ
jgi:hypothetical protein